LPHSKKYDILHGIVCKSFISVYNKERMLGEYKMTLKNFLKLIEIQTKLASLIPFAIGTAFALYRYKSFNSNNFIIMFISLFTFDMATTAINNYLDYKKLNIIKPPREKDDKLIHKYDSSEGTVLTIIFILLSVAVIFGILLYLNTNLVVLFIGIISFSVGILYTFGPIPISRMPLGELFSGVFMGFIILFLSVYIHVYDGNLISFVYKNNMLNLSINIVEIFYIFLISIPLINGIANIMLANNICDVDEDISNNRFTLPYYLGREKALKLFKLLYYIGYIDIIILALLKIVPLASLLILLTFILVNKNIKLFSDKPMKNENFVLSVKNFFLMNIPQAIIFYLFL
jgi:1,4-dihydroxy-2-naphthoate octaprenyltransferase